MLKHTVTHTHNEEDIVFKSKFHVHYLSKFHPKMLPMLQVSTIKYPTEGPGHNRPYHADQSKVVNRA
jgi:hypothetical protein